MILSNVEREGNGGKAKAIQQPHPWQFPASGDSNEHFPVCAEKQNAERGGRGKNDEGKFDQHTCF